MRPRLGSRRRAAASRAPSRSRTSAPSRPIEASLAAMCNRREKLSGSTSASGFRNASQGARVAFAPWLQATAKPALRPRHAIRTRASAMARTASKEPSPLSLSTTISSAQAGSASTRATHCANSGPLSWATTTTATRFMPTSAETTAGTQVARCCPDLRPGAHQQCKPAELGTESSRATGGVEFR